MQEGIQIEPQDLLIGLITKDVEKEGTRRMVAALTKLGAGCMFTKAVSPIAAARNVLLTRIVDELPEDTQRRILLCIDDDTVATAATAIALAQHSWETGHACSGCYVDAHNSIVAKRVPRSDPASWETGLGFFALPLTMLRELAASFEYRLAHPSYPRRIFPFCQEGKHPKRPREWCNEDAWFCQSLPQPVDLLPLLVGHVKSRELYPHPADVKRLLQGEHPAEPAS